MKNRKSTKLLALGLVFALGLGMSTAFAALSVVPATTKVTVDGQAVEVEAYNIDNGNNYFKLRDFATNLDFGLTWDAATDTAAIDTTAHYKPDEKQLITGNWAPATRARIQAVIDENADSGKYVVFDFDNTSVIFDVEEALLIYQIENLAFKIDPADLEGVLETQIPDLNSPVAIAKLFDWVRHVNALNDGTLTATEADIRTLRETFDTVLGTLLGLSAAADAAVVPATSETERLGGVIDMVLEVRQQAKAAKDWATSDLIRDRLAALGIRVKDHDPVMRIAYAKLILGTDHPE